MHRSSESIGAIAAALAKAQAELSNPEKSLIGVIGPSTPREPRGERSAMPRCRAAWRSCARASVATPSRIVQTTAIDQDAGLVRLNTVLAHASGEWVASEWPVCRIGDMASPQRMGAALTYARRYALFTLVGIAGEDDLDAPDLGAPREPDSGSPSEPNGQSEPSRRIVTGDANGSRKRPPTPKMPLQPDASAALREQLLSELAATATADEATVWAQRKLPAKNSLTPDDADVVEHAFRARLQSVERMETDQAAAPPPSGDQRDKSDAQPGPNAPNLDSDTGLPLDNTVISDAPKRSPDRGRGSRRSRAHEARP
jgi:hypothetical protein